MGTWVAQSEISQYASWDVDGNLLETPVSKQAYAFNTALLLWGVILGLCEACEIARQNSHTKTTLLYLYTTIAQWRGKYAYGYKFNTLRMEL